MPDLIAQFPHALNVIESRLRANAARKGDDWKWRTVHEHLVHLTGHYDELSRGARGDDDLCAIALRAIMALEIREAGK